MKTLNLSKTETVDLKNIIRYIFEAVYDIQDYGDGDEYQVECISLSESELQTLINLANNIFNNGELVKICNNVDDLKCNNNT